MVRNGLNAFNHLLYMIERAKGKNR